MQNQKFTYFIAASRPKTLFASLSPVILSLALAQQFSPFQWIMAILCLLVALLLQIASNLANDFVDGEKGIDGPQRTGPQRMTASGLLNASEIKLAFYITVFLAILLGIYPMIIGGPFIVAIGVSSLLFSYLYSGGPYPLSHYALGEISAFIFFGLLVTLGTAYLQMREVLFIHENLVTFLVIACLQGAYSFVLLGINNLRDIHSDAKVNKMTLATILGASKHKILLLFVLIIPFVMTGVLAWKLHFYMHLYSFILLPKVWRLGNFILNNKVDAGLNQALAQTAKVQFIHSIMLAATLVLFTMLKKGFFN